MALRTDYEFAAALARADRSPDLTFVCTEEEPPAVDLAQAEAVDVQGRNSDGTDTFVFAKLADRCVVRTTGVSEFHVFNDRIVCHLLHPSQRFQVEIALLGMVLALWLEQRGVPTLHGSAVVVAGRATAFLGLSRSGKSSMAAGFVGGGHPLLSDDLLALEETPAGFKGRPGYPAMRLWPEQAQRFIPAWDTLATVRPDTDKRRVPIGPGGMGSFANASVELARLYLLDRGPAHTELALLPVPPQEAIMTTVAHSFLPREMQRFGLQAQRLPILARLVARVPVVRLRYPSGFERLTEVVAAVEEDLAS